MQTRIDHLVLAGPDLAELVDHVTGRTGVAPVDGGPHVGLGTRNALLGLGGMRYLELVAPDPDQPEPQRPRPFGIDRLTAPRLVGWSVRTHEMDDLLAAARRSGYDPGAAVSMSRVRPDGETLTWRVTPTEGGLDGILPFLIDWGETPHPTEGLPLVELVTLNVVHPDLAAVTAGLRAMRLRTGAPVRLESGPRRLSATLNTAEGRIELG